MTTKAEQRARKFADDFEQLGFSVEVKVTEQPATLFTSGEVMIPARTIASFRAHGRSWFEASYYASFCSYDSAPGHRASTSMINAWRSTVTSKGLGEKLTLKSLINWLGTEQFMAQDSEA